MKNIVEDCNGVIPGKCGEGLGEGRHHPGNRAGAEPSRVRHVELADPNAVTCSAEPPARERHLGPDVRRKATHAEERERARTDSDRPGPRRQQSQPRRPATTVVCIPPSISIRLDIEDGSRDRRPLARRDESPPAIRVHSRGIALSGRQEALLP